MQTLSSKEEIYNTILFNNLFNKNNKSTQTIPTDSYNKKNVDGIINDIDLLNNEIYKMEENIKNYKKLINNKQKKLWNECDHCWIRDNNAAFDDHIKFHCKKCKLWKSRYLYT